LAPRSSRDNLCPTPAAAEPLLSVTTRALPNKVQQSIIKTRLIAAILMNGAVVMRSNPVPVHKRPVEL